MEQQRAVWNQMEQLWSRHGRCDDGAAPKESSWARDEKGGFVFFRLLPSMGLLFRDSGRHVPSDACAVNFRGFEAGG